MFNLFLHPITFKGHLAHLAYHVHKSVHFSGPLADTCNVFLVGHAIPQFSVVIVVKQWGMKSVKCVSTSISQEEFQIKVTFNNNITYNKGYFFGVL